MLRRLGGDDEVKLAGQHLPKAAEGTSVGVGNINVECVPLLVQAKIEGAGHGAGLE